MNGYSSSALLGERCTDLETLFTPRSIAVVGASNDERRFGGRPIQYLRLAGYSGPIYPVNPRRDEVQGLPAFASIRAINSQVDCAVISVAADDAVEAVRECAQVGVRSAVLFSPGFAEVGGVGMQRQRTIVQIARQAGMRLLGPNCMGFFNARASVYATFASALETGPRAPGPIGLVSQSGGYGGYVLKHAFMRELGIGYWVTTGNESDVDLAETLLWLAGREDLRILLAYMEGVRSGERLVAAFDLARRTDKSIVVMKVGRTEAGRSAAKSHTAALTGEDEVYDAIFRQYGVHRARTTEELLDVTYALAKKRLPAGRRVGVVSISGGIGVQIADFVSDAGLELTPVPAETQAALKHLVPFCSPNNPIDMTGLPTADHDLMERALDAVLGSGAFDAVLVFLGITGAAPSMATPLRDALAAAYSRHPEQLLLLSVTASDEMVRSYDAAGMLVFEDPARAVGALAALAGFAATRGSALAIGSSQAVSEIEIPPELPVARHLNEVEAKSLLARCGIRAPREHWARTPQEAAAAARELQLPLALKIVSRDILHKSDFEGVELALSSPDAVLAAAQRMERAVRARAPAARLEGFLVSEMIQSGLDCLVGVHADPTFGPIVTVGLGGVLVELYADVARRRAPVGADEARAMLRELKSYQLLSGYRGRPPHDVEALANAISTVSTLAACHADRIAAIEINPLRVLPAAGGVLALDAVVELHTPAAADVHSDNAEESRR